MQHMLPTKADKPQGKKTRGGNMKTTQTCRCFCALSTPGQPLLRQAQHLSYNVFKMQINIPQTQTGSALFMSHGHKGAENNGDRKGTGCFAGAAHFHCVYVTVASGLSRTPCTDCHWDVLTGRLIFVLHASSCGLRAVLSFILCVSLKIKNSCRTWQNPISPQFPYSPRCPHQLTVGIIFHDTNKRHLLTKFLNMNRQMTVNPLFFCVFFLDLWRLATTLKVLKRDG